MVKYSLLLTCLGVLAWCVAMIIPGRQIIIGLIGGVIMVVGFFGLFMP